MKKLAKLLTVLLVLTVLTCTLVACSGGGGQYEATETLDIENRREYLNIEEVINCSSKSIFPYTNVPDARYLYRKPSMKVVITPKDDTHVFSNATVTVSVSYIFKAWDYNDYNYFVGWQDLQHKQETVQLDATGSGTIYIASSSSQYVCGFVSVVVDSVEGKVSIPCVHDWKDGETISVATCTEDGEISQNCTKCEKIRNKTVEKLGHQLSSTPISTVPATCTSNGSETYECERCGEDQTNVIDALGHKYDEEDAKTTPATCTNDGRIEYTCTRCNTVNTEVIGKLGHSFTNYKTTVATCLDDSYKTAKCDRCDEVDTIINHDTALGHEYGSNGECIRCETLNPNLQVTSLEITNQSFLIEAEEPVQITYAVYPANAIYKNVTYRIYQNNTCDATLTETGVLTCAKVGSVTVAVTIDDEITARATFYVPQMITTAEEFNDIRNDLDGVYMLANDIDLSGYANWTPIGNATKNSSGNYDYTNAFSGKFDGGGYTISGLNINLGDSSCSSLLTVGLFGSLSRDGQVSNVVLEDVEVTGTSSATDYVGMLIGFNPGSVNGCDATGTMTVSGATYVGGVIGENIGSAENIDSSVTIAVTGSKNYFVGGITGRTTGGQLSNANVTGSINVTSSTSVYVGGVAGNLVDKLTTASADVDITVTTTSSNSSTNYVGIIAGASSQSLSDVTVDGSITVNSYSNAYVGGIVGYSSADILSCVNNATISLTINNSSSVSSYVGGIAGYTSKNIEDSTNNGTISAMQIYGGCVGGIAGEAGEITESENNVDVYVKTFGAIYGGGVAGRVKSINSSTNNAKVDVLLNAEKGNYVGGVVGYVGALMQDGEVADCTNNENAEITISYSSATSSTNAGQHVGGVVGYVIGDVSDCTNYADLSIYSNGVVSVGGVVGLVNGSVANANNYGCSLSILSNYTSSSYSNYVGGVAGYVSETLDTALNTANLSITKGKVMVGGVVGYVGETTTSAETTGNITVKNAVSGENVVSFIGGVVGNAQSSVTNSFATNSYVKVDSKNKLYVGGVAGNSNGTITGSYSYPDITVNNGYVTYVGGVSGQADKIVKSYSTSDVSSSTLGAYDLYTGGLSGYVTTGAEESYATGDVSAIGSSKVYVAGLVGSVYNNAKVINCYVSNGYVKSDSSSCSSSLPVTIYNGGLVGYNSGTISYSYAVNYGYSISYGSSNSHSHYIGGLVGYNSGSVSTSFVLDATDKLARTGLEINRDVVGSGTADNFYAGGFVGYNQGTVANSYSDATVNTTVSGAYTGGFVGFNNATIKNSIAYGEVNSGITGDTTGGFAGGGNSGYTSCFFSKDTTLQTTSVGSATQSGVVASTNANLRTASTFSGFSSSYWNIVDGTYPSLVFGNVWENKSDGFNKYNMLVNVPNKDNQYQFPHGSRVTISFESNGGGTIEDIQATKGKVIILPTLADYQSQGIKYVFCGWCTDSECLDIIDSKTLTVTNSQKLYAYYCQSVAKPQAIKYTYNGEEFDVTDSYETNDYYTTTGVFKATTVGEYKVTFKLSHGYCWEDSTLEDHEIIWEISPYVVNVPNIYDSNEYLFYVGQDRDLSLEFSDQLYTITGDTVVDRLDVDIHTIEFALIDTQNYVWSDSTNSPKSFDYHVVTGACGTTNSNVVYRLVDSTLTILGEGEMANYTSSSSVPWYDSRDQISSVVVLDSVTSIGSYAFSYCKSLTSITIPDSVTSIGSYAFENCTSLTSITIPDSVTSIGSYAFINCTLPIIYCEAESKPIGWNYQWNYSSYPVVWDCNNNDVANNGYIYTVVDGIRYGIKDGVATVVKQPRNIVTANIQSSVTYKENTYAVTSIDNQAFYNFTSLTTITIPDSVTSIGSYAFYNCTSLNKVNYLGTIDQWVEIEFGSYDSNPLYYANNLYINDVLVEDAVLTTATKISDGAFNGCTSLTSITISDSVTSIGNSAFRNCESLTSITIPDSVASIGSYAFANCTLLETAIFGADSNLESIGLGVFRNCESLTSITIPDSVTNIGENAFYDCTSLETVIFGTNSNLESIGYEAFYNCYALTSITIPDSVTNIGEDAFRWCTSLESITLPFVGATKDGTENTNFGYIFGASSYEENERSIPLSLKSVTITGGESIDEYAFSSCTSLTSITILDGVTNIGQYAFNGCTSLESITIPFVGATKDGTDNTHFGYIFGASSYGSNYGSVPISLKSVTITGGESIGQYAFYNCTSLTSITIPDSVTSIGKEAFSGCNSLKSITLPFVGATKKGTTNTHFGYIFGASSYAYNSSYVPTSLKTVTITGGTSIGSSAFSYCTSLTSITIPDSVTSIGRYAFEGCTSLENITLPFVGATKDGTSYSHFGYIFGALSYTDNNDYVPSSLKTVMITKEKSIGTYAFYNCTRLTSITIPDSVTSIASHAFSYCKSLTSITIPDSVTNIGDYAFRSCTSLTSITIPDNVMSIVEYAFSECTSLTIYCEVESKPSGWNSSWNNGYPVVWNCNNNEVADDGYIYTVVDGIRYGIKDGVATVVEQPRNMTTANIPSSVTYKGNTYMVTSIGSDAFRNCYSLTSITIPDSVTSIGEWAFYNCNSLTSITIPDSVTNIGWCAFYNCTSLTSITIPDSVTSIGSQAFYNCTSLESVTFGENSELESIGTSAFYKCTSLTSITIPDSVTSIGDQAFYNTAYYNDESNWENGVLYIGNHLIKAKTSISGAHTVKGGTKTIAPYAFYNCASLTRTTILDSVTSIGSYAFYGCTSLTSITIPDSVESIDSYAFSSCKSLTSITIPDSVESIGEYAFAGCAALKTIFFGENSKLKSIGSRAFANCNSLTSIAIPDSVTSIGEGAFYYCTSLTTVTIPDGVTSIGEDTFCSCKLTSITIPDSVTSIGQYAFYGCTSLVSITIPDSVTSIASNAFSNTAYYKDESNWNNGVLYISNHLIKAKTSISGAYTVKGETRSIADSAFSDCTSITSITIPSSVTSICSYAFYYCTSLKNVIFEENSQLESICSYTFYNCKSLTSITISNGVANIGESAFAYCTALNKVNYLGTIDQWVETDFSDTTSNPLYYAKNLYINDVLVEDVVLTTATKISSYAFRNCTSLTTITITDNVRSIGQYAFNGCTSLESITIPDSVTSIGDATFYKCTSLTSITIPDSVTSIGEDAFEGCTSLTSITIPDSVTSIGSSAFRGCTSLESVTFGENSKLESIAEYVFINCTSLTSIIIPDSVTSIGGYAFCECTSLESVTLGENRWFLSIGSHAFSSCTSLTSIIIPDSVTSIGGYAFSNCTSLESVIFGENNQLEGIGQYAFSNCISLISITIPDSVTSIGEYAFYGCTSLESVILGENSRLQSIGSYAFSSCKSLTSITIPDSVESIGDRAFINCTELKNVTFGVNSRLVGIGDHAFHGCTSLESVTFGENRWFLRIGDWAFAGCSSLTSITIPDSVTSIGQYAFYNCTSLTKITFEDTSTWYKTTSSSNWANNTGGTKTTVTNSSTNATYFKSTYDDYYWYKL